MNLWQIPFASLATFAVLLLTAMDTKAAKF